VSDEEVSVPDYFPVSFVLPQAGTHKSCPACGSRKMAAIDSDGDLVGSITASEFTVEYHRYGVLSAPCGEQFSYNDLKDLGPHLCKKCVVCGYGWSESVNTDGA
jgi:hypothetical protein